MPRKILIVDDNTVNRRLLVKTLSPDYDIIEAENGREAMLQMYKNYKILSAVLLDIVMPEIDGYEVLRAVRDNVALSQIPIIMVTASGDEESRVRSLSLGANDFISKPYNPDIIKHCLRNNIALRETASILNAIQKDKLTGLYNREAFFDKVTTQIKSREPGFYILSCFDIDNFKLINDQYGAVEGDRILRLIGKAAKAEIEAAGGIAGRISADNFAVLYPETKRDIDLMRCIRNRNIVLLEQQAVTFSVGRYIVTDVTLPASALYDRAYIAKQSVKGRYDKHLAYFDEAMLERLVMNQQITGEMESALAEKQFEIWFQPQYNHEMGSLVGAEALVRWRHPVKGIIAPGDFVPLFEQNGFIFELDKYVWRETCRYLRKWLDNGKTPLPVSVNVSRYDIFRTGLVTTLTDIVNEFRIPTELLRIEITESAFSTSTDLIVKIVNELIRFGFTVEIDDFGSGYSSLNTLKNVPAQVVKLDMRFLEGNNEAHRGGNILESIVRMTKWLGMTVLAEGVEDRNQADFLKSIGCTYVQGYLYAKPMPAADYEALCESGSTLLKPFTLEPVNGINYSSFWDPDSIDTMIFNNYSGGACVYEYSEGTIELLRVSDKYVRMVFGADMTVDKLMQIKWAEHMDAKTSDELTNAIETSIKTKCETEGEYLLTDLPGCRHETYLRTYIRAIASVGKRHLVYCVSENITEQREAEHERKAASERLSAILNNVNSGIVAVALYENRIELIFANDRLFGILGCSKEEFSNCLSETPELVCPEDAESVRNNMSRVMSSDEPVTFDYRVNRLDGKQIWVRQSCVIMSFADIDAPIRLSVIYDITAEKLAEQKAAKAENEQRIMINSIQGGIASYECIVDTGYFKPRISYFNDGFCKLLGYTRDEYSRISAHSASSLVFKDDFHVLEEQLKELVYNDKPVDCIIRINIKDGGFRWVNLKSVIHAKKGNTLYSNAVLIDVTSRQEMLERLRISEEEYRLAVKLSGNSVALYTISDKTLTANPEAAIRFGNDDKLTDVPYGQVHEGIIAAESVQSYVAFYEAINNGKAQGSAVFCCKTPEGWKWLEAHHSSIFSTDGKPVSAVISIKDVSEQLEKEAVYKKWKQSFIEKKPDSYSLIRCNLSKKTYNDTVGGELLCDGYTSDNSNYDERAADYTDKCVCEADREAFLRFVNSDTLLSEYEKQNRFLKHEYREKTEDGYRWLLLSIDMIVFPNSDDIEAFLMFENIDDTKRAELQAKALTENDPLTDVLNRATFISMVKNKLKASREDAVHALFMLDIDGFKLVNDMFGHAEGDKTLVEIARILRSVMRKEDFIGRLGGDEFMVFMGDIPTRNAAADKARLICQLTRKVLSMEVHISGSVGIAISPDDGTDFETLYKKADAALYSVKESGKNNYEFYSPDKRATDNSDRKESVAHLSDKKKRILIVDDNKIDFSIMTAIFENDFIIEKANDGNSALICMRHYGSALSAVLLDLVMPGMDGFVVLERMKTSAELQSIPVIVVSGEGNRESCLRSIRSGAADFVTKPIDADILRIRVMAAIEKSAGERIRAKSSYRELQNDEITMYQTVLEHTGTVVSEHDWISGKFTYGDSFSSCIAGLYNDRKLWQIFLSDMVTDVVTVQRLQEFEFGFAGDRSKTEDVTEAYLKVPSGAKHLFRVSIYKIVNDFGLTDKLVLSFEDTERATACRTVKYKAEL